MKLYIQRLPFTTEEITLLVWIQADGAPAPIPIHEAPAVVAVMDRDPATLDPDTGKLGRPVRLGEAPALIARLRGAAAETVAAWRRYDPAASLDVVELPWASAA